MTRIRIIDGQPQVCVKDRSVWARDPRLAAAYQELPEAQIEAIYEGVQEDFWSDIAPDIAEEHGYGREVYSEGHSGGWLVLGKPASWVDYLDTYPADADRPLPITGELGDTSDSTDHDHNRAEARRLQDPDERGDHELAHARVERDRFMRFADEIHNAVKVVGETFVQRCQEAVAELERRRQQNTILSEN